MLNFSWMEILLIGAIALIVIGPKELPGTLRTIGRMIGKIRRLASDFQGQFNEALREADLDHVRKDLDNLNKQTTRALNPAKSMRDEFINARNEVKGAIDGTGETTASGVSEPRSGDAAQAGASDLETGASAAPGQAAPAKAVAEASPAKPSSGKPSSGKSSSGKSSSGKPSSGKPSPARSTASKSAGNKTGAGKAAGSKPTTGSTKTAAAKSGSSKSAAKATAREESKT